MVRIGVSSLEHGVLTPAQEEEADEPSRWPLPPVAAAYSAALTVALPVAGRALGFLAWRDSFDGERAGLWSIGVTVMVWHTALAVVVGAHWARKALRRPGTTWLELLGALLPAMGGAMFAIPFVAAMAGSARVDGVRWPGLSMALAVPSGALVGLVLGLVVLRRVRLQAALWLHIVWIWVLGFVSVVVSWGDEVRQSVPLGAAAIGGPGRGAGPWEVTTHEATQSLLTLVALIGPVVVSVLLAWWIGRSPGGGGGVAFAAALLGPTLVLLAYIARPDAIVGQNAQWCGLALKVWFLALVATATTALVASILRRPRPPAPTAPLTKVKIRPQR